MQNASRVKYTNKKDYSVKIIIWILNLKVRKVAMFISAFVVTSTQNHWIIHLFNIIEILNKFKIFQDHQIRKFSNNIDLRKLDF